MIKPSLIFAIYLGVFAVRSLNIESFKYTTIDGEEIEGTTTWDWNGEKSDKKYVAPNDEYIDYKINKYLVTLQEKTNQELSLQAIEGDEQLALSIYKAFPVNRNGDDYEEKGIIYEAFARKYIIKDTLQEIKGTRHKVMTVNDKDLGDRKGMVLVSSNYVGFQNAWYSQWEEAPFFWEGKNFKFAEHWMMEKKAEIFKPFAEVNDRIHEVLGNIEWINEAAEFKTGPAAEILTNKGTAMKSNKAGDIIRSLGRAIENYVPYKTIWEGQPGDEHLNYDKEITSPRFYHVVSGNLLKFSSNIELYNEIMSYGDKVFVEVAPYDPIWGIGLFCNVDEAGQINRTENKYLANPYYGDATLLETPQLWKGINLLGRAITIVRDTFKEIEYGFNTKEFHQKVHEKVRFYEEKLNERIEEIKIQNGWSDTQVETSKAERRRRRMMKSIFRN